MSMSEEQEIFFMKRAIQLAQKGRLTAPPNPWVGCLLVKEGVVVGEGYHISPGRAHAEIVALEKAGVLAQKATAYVTLEPCAHHGRTPPCTQALIAAGIAKVVIPFLDPDPRVSGQGVEVLRKAGIEVAVGVCREEAFYSLEPYLHQRKNKTPFCVLKAAVSLDGKIAAQDGSSKWITEEKARYDVQLLRARSQAIIIGSQTAFIDRPSLTVREIPVEHPPLRVVIDSKGIVPPEGPLFDTRTVPTLIFTSEQCALKRIEAWAKKGVEVLIGQWPLSAVLEELGKRGVIQALVEGGGGLYDAFLQKNLVHRCILYVGGKLLGAGGRPFLPHLALPSMNEAIPWVLEEVERFGNDVRLDYRVLPTELFE